MLKEETKFENSDLMEGMSSISALIKGIQSGSNPRKILRILIDCEKASKKRNEIRFLEHQSKDLNFTIEFTDAKTIDAMSVGNTHGGIIAECSSREIPMLTEQNIRERGVYFILEGIEDPYNFGYTVRSLYAAGVNGLILTPRNWMGAAGVVARSSAGCSELMELYISDPSDAIQMMKYKGYTVLCAGIRDSVSLFDVDLSMPLCVVLGGEKRGISRTVLEKADQIVRIDYGNSFGGSLSSAASAAVFAFEILRYNR